MSSIYYESCLWFSGHQNRGIAKSHGHAIPIDTAPVICGYHCDCEFSPEVGVARIKTEFEGWRDMTRDEIVAAEKMLHDLLPGD